MSEFDEFDLKERILAEILGLGGPVGVAILDTRTGRGIQINADEPFPAASVIKICIFVEMLFQIREKRIDFNTRVDIPNGMARTRDPVDSSGALCLIQSPISLMLSELAALMMIISDNVAADILLERLGTDAINNRMKSLGLKSTQINTIFYDPELLSQLKANPTTANDMTTLLGHIYHGTIPYSKYLASILEQQRFRNRLPFLLPNNAITLNKTGTLIGDDGNIIVNDVGIIVTGNHDLVICFLSNHQRSSADTSLAIASIARTVYSATQDTSRLSWITTSLRSIRKRILNDWK